MKAEPPHKAPFGLRTVAVFELVKGLLVLVLGLAALSLVGKDVGDAVADLLHRLHLDPSWHYSKLFIDYADRMNDTGLKFSAIIAFVYAAVRFVETYGLWHERPWAEWFAVLSAGLWLPVEIHHIVHRVTLPGLAVLGINLLVIVYLARLLAENNMRKRLERMHRTQPTPAA